METAHASEAKPHRTFSSALISLCLALPVMATAQENQENYQGETTRAETPASSSTIVYGADFFAQYPNAVSVLDLIRRIPSGQSILNSGGNQNRRGFSGNDDKILINGKRQSGKSNDAESTLGRITVAQVERIEIIRGSSPDIKVSSSDGIINIVLKEGATDGGSGSWGVGLRSNGLKNIDPNGSLSFGSSAGKLDYMLSVEGFTFANPIPQSETLFDGAGTFQRRLDEDIDQSGNSYETTANLVYNISDQTALRLNGLYSRNKFSSANEGVIFEPDMLGAIVETGNSHRLSASRTPAYEIGGDFETPFSDDVKFKFLALYSYNHNSSSQREDFLIEGDEPEDDFLFISDSIPTEAIARSSITWQVNADHSLEIGSEMALNDLQSTLQFFELENGVLVERDISTANTTIKETRNESFIIHSWKLDTDTTIDSQLFTEWSKLEQSGVDVARSRTFFFLKPAVDLRYNISESDQIQLSIRRVIEQLNFGDFASSASDDDQVVAGNSELQPEKYWEFEAVYEHRLANDGGRIKFGSSYRKWQDKIDLVEISPGVSGRGNIGSGTQIRASAEGSFRMIMIGLPDLVIEPSVTYIHTRVTDEFTGRKRRFNWWWPYNASIDIRHDVSSLGLSYGISYFRGGTWRFNDIDETIDFPHQNRLDIFVEKQLFKGIVLRVDGFNLNLRPNGRERNFFEAGIAGGVLTSREIRTQTFGRILDIGLRGTF